MLVMSREYAELVKGIVEHLKRRERTYARSCTGVPTMGMVPGAQLRRPLSSEMHHGEAREALSLQRHFHRSEHWVVVNGTLEVTKGDSVELLSENQSTYIPLGEKHRLANPGKIPAFLIEVQSGSYLDEDDIVRFDDVYGRNS